MRSSATGFANNTLINKGPIDSAGSNFSAVNLDNGSATVVNYAGAEIIGASDAVDLSGTGSNSLSNSGKIIGATGAGVGFGTSADGDLLYNHGYIFGASDGVFNFSTVAGGAIHNFDTIRSDGSGILIETAAGVQTSITNAADALIDSFAGRAIVGFGGSFRLVNHGTIIGGIVDHAGGNDVIINPGKISGPVALGSGNDYFNGAGGTSGAIYASGGNDRIIAGKGNVAIHVGTGNSTLTGGPGHDTFFFDDLLLFGQVDRINHFNPSRDKIVLSEAAFADIGPVGSPLAAAEFHIGPHATASSQHIIYNPNTGFIVYDPHNGPQVHFATIGAHLALTHGDFLVEA
jgi:Ca2+-binding RTX toxin-like protein